MIKRIAIITICLLAALMYAEAVVFYRTMEFLPSRLTIFLYSVFVLLPAGALFLSNRYLKDEKAKGNVVLIVLVFLFFALINQGLSLYGRITKPLSEGAIMVRQEHRIIKSINKWLEYNASYYYSGNVKILYTDDFGVDTIPKTGEKCYFIRINYNAYRRNKKEDGVDELTHYFFIDEKNNVMGIKQRNWFESPTDLNNLETKTWINKYGVEPYEGP